MTNNKTWIDDEEGAYNGGFARRGRAILRENPYITLDLPYGKLVAFRASIPDTAFSIPARFTWQAKRYKAYISSNDGTLEITPERTQTK